MGFFFALGAMLCWGLGDFLIQRNTRRFGDGLTLFCIAITAAIALTPFVYRDIGVLWSSWPLGLFFIIAGCLDLVAALTDFEGLRQGKLSVMMPIYSAELVVTALFGLLILHEFLSFPQSGLIAMMFLGLVLLSVRSFHHVKRLHAERGVGMITIAMLLMGVANIALVMGARMTNPLFMYWFSCVFISLAMAVYLTRTRQWPVLKQAWRQEKGLVLGMCALDNAAWIFYLYAGLTLPVAIATGISEGYVTIAVILGLLINRERLRRHQWVGLILSLAAVAVLGFILS